jgi:uncharacterized protein YjbJ (UPF0337 family)
MNGTTQVAKGRIKEAAGVLTGNDRLRAQGQTDQAVGHVKQAAKRGVRQVKESARKMVDRAKHAAQGAVDKAKSRSS